MGFVKCTDLNSGNILKINDMTKEIVLEVIEKLIGNVNPVADSAIDYERFKNLKLFIDVFDEMHTVIDNIPYRWKDSNYNSVKPFVDACNKQLDKMGISE